jgi:dTMP kinase
MPDRNGATPGLPGRLIIVEGIDGSGKSTQLDLLRKWLISQGYVVVFSEWNSSPIVRATTRRAKNRRLFSPMSFSLIHAADFASRTYAQILPALQAGAIVLADRYVYTAYARDAARGVDRA